MNDKQKEKKIGVFQVYYGKYGVIKGNKTLGNMKGGFRDFASAKKYAIEQYKKDGIIRYILYIQNAKVVYAE